jgi:hypothetical protein
MVDEIDSVDAGCFYLTQYYILRRTQCTLILNQFSHISPNVSMSNCKTTGGAIILNLGTMLNYNTFKIFFIY